MTTAALYERMWDHAAYRHVAPGEHLAHKFIEVAKPTSRVIDFGAGTGRGATLIHAMTGLPVTALDWAANCLDAGADVDFIQHDLRNKAPVSAEFGYCTDVMEHIAPEDVDRVLYNVLSAARRVFFSISTVPDHFGPAVAGEPLHLTVQPHAWWREKLAEQFQCHVLWEHDAGEAAMFYVSAYATAQDIMDRSAINETEDRIRANIMANLALDLREVVPHPENTQTVYLLGGGPSLADFEAQIVAAGRAGTPIVTTNGTYSWLLERGIKPAAQVMVDARAFNARFVSPVVDTCKYLMGSQVDNAIVASLPRDQVWLWHSADSKPVEQCIKERAEATGVHRSWFPVHGGTTVMLRALPLLAMLGFRRVEVFGWDSCLRDEAHHAYAQKENDCATVVEVSVGGKTFRCHPWMLIQAHEVQRVIRHVLGRLDGFEMAVHGDGLIAHVLQTAANAAERH